MKIYKIANTEDLQSSDFEWFVNPEVFNFVSSRFDVKDAKEIIKENPRPIMRLNIGHLQPWVGQREKDEDGWQISGVIGINWEKMDGDVVDLSIPVIVAQKDGNTLPIDGWHRIAKALDLGLKDLPAVLLTEEETRQISGG